MPKTTWPKKPPHRRGECCGYAPSTKLKRFETVKAFFSFCVSRDWIAKDSAGAVKVPKVRHIPTLPFSDAEIEKFLWSVDTFREIHSQIPVHRTEAPGDDPPSCSTPASGISDGVVMKPDRIRNGKPLLYTHKTGTSMWCPLRPHAPDALKALRRGRSVLLLVREWDGVHRIVVYPVNAGLGNRIARLEDLCHRANLPRDFKAE
jgi:hypothetical protein